MKPSLPQPGEKTRNSSIEVLRILAMFFIILWHSNVHGSFPDEPSGFLINNLFLSWNVLGDLGVDLFILITGYFLCEKGDHRNALLRLCGQVWFYSLLSFAIYTLFGNPFQIKRVVCALFPIVFIQYWFFTVYVIFLLFLPYVNLFLAKSSQKQLLTCIASMVAVWSVIPTGTLGICDMFGNHFLQFLMFYLIGAYFKKYPRLFLEKARTRVLFTCVSFLLLFASSTFLHIFQRGLQEAIYSRYSLPVMGCAVGLFSIAIYRNPFSNKLVNTIAGSVFGIYLLHDNPMIRSMLWPSWLPNHELYQSALLVPAVLGSAILVFIIGAAVELFRKRFLEKPILALLGSLFAKLAPLMALPLRKGAALFGVTVDSDD